MRADGVAIRRRCHGADHRPAFVCGGCAPFYGVTVGPAVARMRRQPYVAVLVRGHEIAPQKQKAPFRRTEGVASKTYNTLSCGFLKTTPEAVGCRKKALKSPPHGWQRIKSWNFAQSASSCRWSRSAASPRRPSGSIFRIPPSANKVCFIRWERGQGARQYCPHAP